jgi:hypothetical protein
MDKKQLTSVFNDQITLFINDLILVYPRDDDLYKFKTSIRMLSLVDESKIIKVFKEAVYNKYKSEILEKNSEFFMNQQYTELYKNNSDDSFTEQLVCKIKGYWKSMSNENRDIVWKYFTTLVLICEKFESI